MWSPPDADHLGADSRRFAYVTNVVIPLFSHKALICLTIFSTARKMGLGGASRRSGALYLRSLFTAGALAVIRYAKIHGTKHRPWLTSLLTRRPTKVAAIALANKLARMAWAMMAKGERYKQPVALAA